MTAGQAGAAPMSEAVYSEKPRSIWSFADPVAAVRNLWLHRHLTWQFARRQIEAKYRSQRLGILWAVLTPLFMLAVYTFVFAVVFPQKFDRAHASSEPLGVYALVLFLKLLVFALFRDMMARAPGMVVGHPNYVKRVVFPLEILPVSELIAALVTFAIGLVVWLVGWSIVEQRLPEPGLLLLPVLLVPVCLFGLGIGWFLSSLGVFIRDLANVVELAVTVLFFLTPIFYSIDHVPDGPLRAVLAANPLAQVVEGARKTAIDGALPDFAWFGWALAISFLAAIAGYAFFMKSKRAFADVI
jgi:lipopolysaccharide transport system permease protein